MPAGPALSALLVRRCPSCVTASRAVLEAFATDGPAPTWRFHRSVLEALEAVTGRPVDDLGI